MRRSRSRGKSSQRPGSNSIVPIAAVLPTTDTCATPAPTPDSRTAPATASVRSTMSRCPCVARFRKVWWTMFEARRLSLLLVRAGFALGGLVALLLGGGLVLLGLLVALVLGGGVGGLVGDELAAREG